MINTECAEVPPGLPDRGSSQGEQECEFEGRNAIIAYTQYK